MGLLSQEPLHGRGRQRLRSLKRLARSGSGVDVAPELKLQSQVIALALLDRSIKFKHRRLALLRFKDAIEMGAQVDVEHWIYCKSLLSLETDGALRADVERAAIAFRSSHVAKVNEL